MLVNRRGMKLTKQGVAYFNCPPIPLLWWFFRCMKMVRHLYNIPFTIDLTLTSRLSFQFNNRKFQKWLLIIFDMFILQFQRCWGFIFWNAITFVLFSFISSFFSAKFKHYIVLKLKLFFLKCRIEKFH